MVKVFVLSNQKQRVPKLTTKKKRLVTCADQSPLLIVTTHPKERTRFLFMNANSISDNTNLVVALDRLTAAVTAPEKSPWLSKNEAYNYLKVSPKTFQKLIDKDVMR